MILLRTAIGGRTKAHDGMPTKKAGHAVHRRTAGGQQEYRDDQAGGPAVMVKEDPHQEQK
jgi:hypothetical protein